MEPGIANDCKLYWKKEYIDTILVIDQLKLINSQDVGHDEARQNDNKVAVLVVRKHDTELLRFVH